MTEWKFFDGDEPHVSTFAFHEHRERAPHLEQSMHIGRLHTARDFVMMALDFAPGGGHDVPVPIIDLGCGDGGLLSLLKDEPRIDAWGYDFQPSNQLGWVERGVVAYQRDFVNDWFLLPRADIYVITECLEHLARPHQMVRRIFDRNAQIICSSPYTEHYASHDECHAWAWDQEGYRQMLFDAGYETMQVRTDGMFQIWWARP